MKLPGSDIAHIPVPSRLSWSHHETNARAYRDDLSKVMLGVEKTAVHADGSKHVVCSPPNTKGYKKILGQLITFKVMETAFSGLSPRSS